jgi:hypothetical protein
MALTSGAINTVTLTRDDVIRDALQDLRVIMDGASPTAGDLTDGTRKLNFLLKWWPTKGLLLWCRDTIQIPCVAAQTTYTIGPSGANVTSYRPLRGLDGTFIRQVSGGNNFDTPLIMLSRIEYQQQTFKASPGIPNSWYYNPTMTQTPNVAYNPANAIGVLSLFNTPVDATRTIFLEVQRPIQEIIDSEQAFDVPVEWYRALAKSLAGEMSDKYEVPEQRLTRIKNEARDALEQIVDWGSTEQAPIRFTPDYQSMNRGPYG